MILATYELTFKTSVIVGTITERFIFRLAATTQGIVILRLWLLAVQNNPTPHLKRPVFRDDNLNF